MKKLLSILLWTLVFLLLLAGLDQLLLRVPARHPAHVAVATFYRDLRSRVVELFGREPVPATVTPAKTGSAKAKEPAGNIETLIEQRRVLPPAAPSGAAGAPTLRYVYADEEGTIQFAETLAEIPAPYRDKARRLAE